VPEYQMISRTRLHTGRVFGSTIATITEYSPCKHRVMADDCCEPIEISRQCQALHT
jgi:hypothetical protein